MALQEKNYLGRGVSVQLLQMHRVQCSFAHFIISLVAHQRELLFKYTCGRARSQVDSRVLSRFLLFLKLLGHDRGITTALWV